MNGQPRARPTVAMWMFVSCLVGTSTHFEAAQGGVREVTIAAGASARYDEANLVVRFDRVLNDSRCPSDVQCIVAGDATVAITATTGRESPRPYQLHTEEAPREVTHGEYTLTLVELRPVPLSTRPVRPLEYSLTLRIAPRSSQR